MEVPELHGRAAVRGVMSVLDKGEFSHTNMSKKTKRKIIQTTNMFMLGLGPQCMTERAEWQHGCGTEGNCSMECSAGGFPSPDRFHQINTCVPSTVVLPFSTTSEGQRHLSRGPAVVPVTSGKKMQRPWDEEEDKQGMDRWRPGACKELVAYFVIYSKEKQGLAAIPGEDHTISS